MRLFISILCWLALVMCLLSFLGFLYFAAASQVWGFYDCRGFFAGLAILSLILGLIISSIMPKKNSTW